MDLGTASAPDLQPGPGSGPELDLGGAAPALDLGRGDVSGLDASGLDASGLDLDASSRDVSSVELAAAIDLTPGRSLGNAVVASGANSLPLSGGGFGGLGEDMGMHGRAAGPRPQRGDRAHLTRGPGRQRSDSGPAALWHPILANDRLRHLRRRRRDGFLRRRSVRRPRRTAAEDAGDWRAAVMKGDFNADLTGGAPEAGVRPASSKSTWRSSASRWSAGNCDRLSNWHWRVWRDPREYGYPLSGKERFPRRHQPAGAALDAAQVRRHRRAAAGAHLPPALHPRARGQGLEMNPAASKSSADLCLGAKAC